MINKKIIIFILLSISFHIQQLNSGPSCSKLTTVNNSINQTQPQKALVGKRHESRPAPDYFKFKQKQKQIFENLPSNTKYVIGQYLGLDKPIKKVYGNSSFFDSAILNNDSNEVQILVALEANLHDKKSKDEPHKTTPLYCAIQCYNFSLYNKSQKKSLAIIDYLLQKKIGINQPVQCQQTPIYRAIDCGLTNVVQRFIAAEADLNVLDCDNLTPLDTAKKNAMNQKLEPKHRKKYYKICSILEQVEAPSSIVLDSMPTDIVMQYQHDNVK